jgi:hypothetical protein
MEVVSKVRHILGASVSKKLFVIGTGRSGTHWLGRIFQGHPNVRATIEVNPGFHWSTQMAVDPSTIDRHFTKLVWYYQCQHFLSAPRHYLDKSHPNLWIADRLGDRFEDSLFLGIHRNPYATVASMLNHNGVQEWHRRWDELPVPNQFLGISNEETRYYEDLSLTAKCTMRWISHREKMEEMKSVLGRRLMVVTHEELISNTGVVLDRLQDFVGLNTPLTNPQPDPTTLDKWKVTLNDRQIIEIEEKTGVSTSAVVSAADVNNLIN